MAAAVAMSAVTALAKEEDGPAFRKGANSKVEKNFAAIRHALGQAGLDNGRLSVAG